MKKRRHISVFIASLLLAIAVLGHTPKLWLHHLLANHTHTTCAGSNDEAQVQTAGFHCDVSQQALVIAFLVPDVITLSETTITGASPKTPVQLQPLQQHRSFPSLRGPPVV